MKLTTVGVLAVSLILLAPASAALALSRPLFVDTFPFGFRGVPKSVKAGEVKVLLFNRPTNAEEHEIAFFKLAPENEGATIADAIAAADAAGGSDDDPTFGGFTTGFNGEVAEVPPGRVGKATVDLTKSGRYVYYCFVRSPANGDQPHYKLQPGMLGFIKAT
ncbi:MAG: hypothetical protein ACRDZ4_01065 [Egibacteraceae bacterium]